MDTRTLTAGKARRRRGATLVEFVIVSSLLFALLLGILEFGMIFRDKIYLVGGARNGARVAATGATLATTRSVTQNTTDLTVTTAQVVIEYNTAVDGSGTWQQATDNGGGTANNVPAGSLLRVRISNWPHTMVTGSFFSWITGVSGGQMNMNAAVVMRRE